MRKVILDLATTLDGYIEGSNGEIDWCIMDDDMGFADFLDSIDAIFYGRVSYEMWGNYQPTDTASVTEKAIWSAVHSKQKYVFSSHLGRDEKATYITSNIADQVKNLKNKAGKDIWLYGGAKLITTFNHLGLIDVYRIAVHPTALGSGKPLFQNLKNRLNLKLIDSKTFRSGVVQLIYEPI